MTGNCSRLLITFLILSLLSLAILITSIAPASASPLSSQVEAIIKSGGRVGPLTPTSTNFTREDNRSFRIAMDTWNAHHWEEAVAKFKKHLKNYPGSPWAGEAALHLGCYARFKGRYEEARQRFEGIITKYPATPLARKARLRLGGVYYLQRDYKKSVNTFKALLAESPTWSEHKYASYWIKRIRRLEAARREASTCGPRSLAICFRLRGLEAEAGEIAKIASESIEGFSLYALAGMSRRYGLPAWGAKVTGEKLRRIKKPLLAFLKPNHFVVLTEISEDEIKTIDPFRGEVTYTPSQFHRLWRGEVLAFGRRPPVAKRFLLTRAQMEEITGACCGIPLPQGSMGSAEEKYNLHTFDTVGCTDCSPYGMPQIQINTVNLNVVVTDIPLFYTPGKGPVVRIVLTNNNDDASISVPFGKSWSFNYNTHLSESPNNNVDLKRPGGRPDTFTWNADGTYTPPPGVHDTLTKNADNTFTLELKDDTRYHYSSTVGPEGGELTGIEDKYGQSLTISYDAHGHFSKLTDASGRVTTFTTDSNGRITKVTDPSGREALFSYDASDNLTQITDIAAYSSSFVYDSQSYITSLSTPLGTTNISYEHPFWETYKVTFTDPRGKNTVYYWNALTSGDPVKKTDANNHHTHYYFDAQERTNKIANHWGQTTTSYGYDTNNNRTSVTDGNNHTTAFVYDANGNVTKKTDPLGNETTSTYDSRDNLTSVTDPRGNTTTYTYDSHDNLTQITYPDTTTVSYTYNSFGKMLTMTDRRNNLTTYTYDTYGNLTKITDPLGKETTFTYDTIGRKLSQTDANGHTTSYTYDNLDRVTRITHPDVTTTQYVYDCCFLTQVTDANNKITAYTYNALGWLTKVTDAHTNQTVYGYDNVGNRTSLTDAEGNITAYEYDAANRLIKTTYPDITITETYTYDTAGNLLSKTDGKGKTTHYSYDALNRLVEAKNQ